MASLESSDDLIQYCYRWLGAPVINIEVDETQAIDRIEDAIQLFTQRHYDGTNEVHISHTVSAKDVSNGFITAQEGVTAVTKLYGVDKNDILGEEFERLDFLIANSDLLNNLGSSDGLVGWYLTKSNIETIVDLFKPKTQFSFNAVSRILDPMDPLKEGAVIMYKCYKSLDVETYEDVYNNEWIKKYTTQLIKRQWGSNLKKFDGVQLPGGVSMNGQVLYDEAQSEIDKLLEEFSNSYELPVDFFVA